MTGASRRPAMTPHRNDCSLAVPQWTGKIQELGFFGESAERIVPQPFTSKKNAVEKVLRCW